MAPNSCLLKAIVDGIDNSVMLSRRSLEVRCANEGVWMLEEDEEEVKTVVLALRGSVPTFTWTFPVHQIGNWQYFCLVWVFHSLINRYWLDYKS